MRLADYPLPLRHFLADEGIALMGGHLRGTMARRIQYWPVSGRARQLAISDAAQLAAQELAAAHTRNDGGNDVELF